MSAQMIRCVACCLVRSHRRRGLCRECWGLHRSSNTLAWFPPLPRSAYRPRLGRLEDFRELAGQEEHRASIAARLAVSDRTLYRYQADLANAA